jgi:aspartate aminotransferase
MISNRLKYFDSSDFREAFLRQQSIVDPIDLSVGLPEELTAEHVKAAGIAAINEDKTVYTPANGIPELRRAIAEKLKRENQIECDEDNVTIVPGLTTGQMLIYLAILDPGDEIIIIDPYYPPYPHLASMIGAHVVYVSSLPDFQPNLAMIEASITNRTKAIVINTPNNPSGAVYSRKTLEKIAEIAGSNDLLVIADEIYEHFVYDVEHVSIASFYPNTITLNGFSKAYAMTGWRLGYMSGPRDLIDAINELQQYVIFSSSSIAQHAALHAIKAPPHSLQERYKKKRDYLVGELKAMGYKVKGGQGAYYIYIKAPNNMEDTKFADIAADNGVIVVPGRSFSASLHGYVRLSYGADMHTLQRAMEVFKKVDALHN